MHSLLPVPSHVVPSPSLSHARRWARLAALVALATSGSLAAGGCSTTGTSAAAPVVAPDGSDAGTTAETAAAPSDPAAPELACTEGVASGFAQKPAPFTLPAARCGHAFDRVSGTGDLVYTLLDVNADRRPDLVVTADACDEEIGTKRWDVYLGSASGFAKKPAPFTLPASRCGQAFGALAGSGEVRYTLLDVDADRRPDLVVTADGCDADVGTKRWDVYHASDDGFTKTPAPFALPASRCMVPFDALSGAGEVRYTLLDVDADRRPDLVVTSDGCDADVGTKRWDVYPASSAGFATTPSAFTLPAARCNEPFDSVYGTGSVRYGLVDINADRRPDLVVTSDTCDAEVGTKRWAVYLSSSAGFAKTPAPFALPATRCGEPFDAVGGTGNVGYALLDLSCDGRGDLVVTSDTCDEEVGKKRWDVYVASDDGFAKAPSSLTLPAARCGESFDALGKVGKVPYSIVDLSADSRVDLLVTSDTCDEEVGKARWDAYALE